MSIKIGIDNRHERTFDVIPTKMSVTQQHLHERWINYCGFLFVTDYEVGGFYSVPCEGRSLEASLSELLLKVVEGTLYAD